MVLALLAALLLVPRPAAAHPAVAAVALIQVRDGGEVTIVLLHDSLSYALNDTPVHITDQQMYALLDGPGEDLAAAFEDGKERFEGALHLSADGRPLAFQLVSSPSIAGVHDWLKDNPSRVLPCKQQFVVKATLAPNTRMLRVQFPQIMGQIILNIDRMGVEPLYLPLDSGELSPEIDVSMATRPPLESASDAAATSDATPAKPTTHDRLGFFTVAWRFVRLGFEHIIPDGPDHCLFVLGLFLLSPKVRPVLWQISAFTVAHTLTLTLTSLHVIGLPSSIVEPTIAASVAFVGIENLLTRRVHSWRPVVAFVFGLVHGMGVATSFNEAGFPPGQLITSLAAFTVGVEAGHLLVLAAAFAILGWTRNKPWYRPRVALPLSFAISAIAIYWFVQRIAPGVRPNSQTTASFVRGS
jgi:hydrogenase/urease accessory protein HupE